MAIIDPEGLFCGERLASCSDMAQLYWPRFFLAANSCARIELSYKSIVSRVFGNFQKIPSSDEIWRIFREYEANFLAVLYESEIGSWWCQFVTSEKYLPRYKKTRDNLSPSPSCETMDAYRYGYFQWKKSKSFNNQSFQKIPEDFQGEGVGIGIGIGVGIGDKTIPSPKPRKRSSEVKHSKDPRHIACKAEIFEYYRDFNEGEDPDWEGREGKSLAMFLSANPKLTADGIQRLLTHRARSSVNHSERPALWIGKLTSFRMGPLNEFGKPLNGGNGHVKISASTIQREQREAAFTEAKRMLDSGEFDQVS